MASCVKNILTKNYQNLIIGFQVTVKNVGDVFWDTAYIADPPVHNLTVCWGVEKTVGGSTANPLA